jgi:hypothetical protein
MISAAGAVFQRPRPQTLQVKNPSKSVTPLGSGKEPLPKWIKSRWYDPNWLKIEKWLNFANDPLKEEGPTINFGIRNFRMISPESARPLQEAVREIFAGIVAWPSPVGRFEPDPLRLFTLALEKTQTSRIRRCGICPRLFHAGRKDQKCCSKRCSNALRQRTFRDNRNRYESNRRQNHAAKLERDKLKAERRLRGLENRNR